jgi:hypothetical protein
LIGSYRYVIASVLSELRCLHGKDLLVYFARKLTFCVVQFFWGRSALETSPKEPGKATVTTVLTNIGFMKSPPKELKKRFPMCDAFFKVEWIEEKRIGYSRYDLYRDGKKKSKT